MESKTTVRVHISVRSMNLSQAFESRDYALHSTALQKKHLHCIYLYYSWLCQNMIYDSGLFIFEFWAKIGLISIRIDSCFIRFKLKSHCLNFAEYFYHCWSTLIRGSEFFNHCFYNLISSFKLFHFFQNPSDVFVVVSTHIWFGIAVCPFRKECEKFGRMSSFSLW